MLERLDKICKDIIELKLGQQRMGLKLEEMVKENQQMQRKYQA